MRSASGRPFTSRAANHRGAYSPSFGAFSHPWDKRSAGEILPEAEALRVVLRDGQP